MRVQYLPTQIALIGILVVKLFFGGTVACAADSVLSETDKAAISAIEFSLADTNLEQFSGTLERQSLVDQVSKNLAGWYYPVKPSGTVYSHRLRATLGTIARQATPMGFSFSSGNSDPRSTDFQKADVLPVTCEFSKTDSGQTGIASTMTFSANQLSAERNPNKLLQALSDHISTTCFNLLEDLKVPTTNTQATDSSFKPSWAPTVRVEVIEEKAPVKAETVTKSETQTQTVDSKSPEISQKVDSEGRKQLIIHNQGTPLIINFGHERK